MSPFSFDKDATMGAVFIGFGISSACFGVLSTQMYTYFHRYPLDRPFYKGLVAALWLLELVDQAFIGHAVYFYLVTNWGNPLILLHKAVWSLILQVTLGATAGAIVKACFAMRVWRFSNGNIYVTGVILFLTLAQLTFACIYTYKGFHTPNLTELAELKLVATFSLGLGVATDVFTASALCYFLRKLRTGYSKDDSLVNRLMLYAVNTGVLTSAISLCTLILYDTMPENFIFMCFYFIVSKLYANSFLATLNTRKVLRGRGTDGEHSTMPTFLMVGKVTGNEFMEHDPEATTGSALEVGISREVSIKKDPVPQYAVAW